MNQLLNFDRELAGMIDHTLLTPDADSVRIEKLCQEALEYQFKSVCVNPFWVSMAAKILKNSPINVCTVIGFPLGLISTVSKVQETREAVYSGAVEVDMVMNIGALKSGQAGVVLDDIRQVVKAARGTAMVKVILETCFLTMEEKVAACNLALQAGADFVKTSTGFGPAGATVDDILLLRETVGSKLGVKASGGIRDYEEAAAMVKAGANRIGTSAGIQIVSHAVIEGKANSL